ncbi:MAG TPA: transglycosylase SLT domain-containing protein [bacterium]
MGHYPKIALIIVSLAAIIATGCPKRALIPLSENAVAQITLQAQSQFHAGNYEKSLDIITNITGSIPKPYLADIHYIRAMNYHMQKEWGNAVMAWEEFLVHQGILSDYGLYYLADSLFKKKDYFLSKEILRTLLEKYPDTRFKYAAQIKQAELLIAMGQTDEGLARYMALMESIPADNIPALKLSLAETYDYLGKSEEATIAYMDIYIRFPNSETSLNLTELIKNKFTGDKSTFAPVLQLNRIQNLVNLSLFDQALKELNNLNISDLPEEYFKKYLYLKALSEYNLRQYNSALSTLELAREKNIEDADIIFLRGKTLSSLKKTDTAIKEYESIISKYGNSQWIDNAYYKIGAIAASENNFNDALLRINHLIDNYSDSDAIIDALWAKVWYSFLASKREDSLSALKSLASRTDLPTLERYKATYWLARFTEESNFTEAQKMYQALAVIEPPNYYTLLANWRLNSISTPLDFKLRGSEVSMPLNEINLFHLERAKKLAGLGFLSDSEVEVKLAEIESHGNIDSLAQVGGFYLKNKMFYDAIIMAQVYFSDFLKDFKTAPPDIITLAYPRGYSNLITEYASKYNIDPNLIYAVIYSESMFQEKVVSRANAIGLMQIIPSTGKFISSDAGVKYFSSEMLLDPEINIGLGTKYISTLINRYSGNLVLLLSHYNAGGGNLFSWLKKWDINEVDKFVENIPFAETRDYIKKVISIYCYYSWLYGGDIDISRSIVPIYSEKGVNNSSNPP